MIDSEEIECSIAVLGFQAGPHIVTFVERMHRSLSLLDLRWEIVVVANYWDADDPTPEIAAELATRLCRVRHIAEPKQGGWGWDMRRGLDGCSGRWIGVIDGDGQFPPEVVLACFAKLHNEGLDMVKTYRVHRGDGMTRRLLSMTYNAVFGLLFPAGRMYRDANSKPKILSREAYHRMDLRYDDWFIDAEVMLAATDLGLQVGEIPVELSALDTRRSFVKPSAIIGIVRHLSQERVRRWVAN